MPERTWIQYQLPSFPDFRNTVYHNRGVGQTECTQELPWTMEDFARDAASLIEQVCEPPVIVVGKSMGALTATQLVLDRPDLVRLAIPMGTLGKSTGWVHDYMRAEIDYRKQGGSLTGLMGVCHYAAMLHPADELGDEETWEVLKASYSNFEGDNEKSLIGQWDACDTFDVLDRLPGLHRAAARGRVRRGRAGAAAVRQAGRRPCADRRVPPARGPRPLLAVVADAGRRGQRHHPRDHRHAARLTPWAATYSAG